ncbi:ABC transporter permease [Pseudactinotalea suaedae]|uniref:ABC transporter permease n=1 Tax=Pseudactinotalea suaedae TaxID=1524924 RepID=UPI0012E2CEF1|nr:ABC transporter permease [Pseudactinotalea suaedae]
MTTPTTPQTHESGISFSRAATIVAKREIMVRLRSKAFVISSIIFLAAVLASAIIGTQAGSLFQSTTSVAVTADAAETIGSLEGYEVTEVSTQDEVRDLILDGTVEAGVVGSPTDGFTVIGERSAPEGLIQALSITPDVELLDPNAPNPFLTYFIGLGFGLVFFMSAMTYGNTIAQSVAEEKQTRIVEILLATIPARALLAGKVIGNSLLAFAQIALVALMVIGAGAATGSAILLDGLGIPLLWFVALFTVGFVMIAALYAATASLVSRVEDLASATSPIMMLVMIPYIMVIIFNNNPTVLAIMSYVPFSAPVAVPMRVFLGTTTVWESVLALAVLVVATVIAIRVAALIYDRSLLRTGKRVKVSEVLRAAG